jgi:hypothetical protein
MAELTEGITPSASSAFLFSITRATKIDDHGGKTMKKKQVIMP